MLCRALLLLAVGAAVTRADEAILADGRRVAGTLAADTAGRVTFQTAERTIPLAQLALVRFYGKDPPPVHELRYRIALVDGSTFAADLLALDEQRLRVQTSWAREVTLPRSAIVSLAPLEGITTPRRVDFDPGQDGVLLANGDQVFGTSLLADRDGVALRMRAGPRKFGWREVRGVYLARQTPEPRTTDGEHVRLWFRSAGGGTDEIEGVLRALDDRQATLTHPELGEVQVDRTQLVRLRGRFRGRRIEIDNGSHHLGDPGHLSATLFPRRAEGTSLRRAFRLTAAAPAHLQIDVSELQTDGVGRLELLVNGKSVADLTTRLDRGVPEPQRIAVEVPERSLRGGLNELELRLTPLRDSERHPSCGVSRLALELPR